MTEEAIYTIGHSTHPIEEFVSLLKQHGIESLIDIRTIPKSRYNPQYQQEALSASLREARISYDYMKDLGGLRKARTDSPNGGWRNSSFRGYADHMQSPAFKAALATLIEKSRSQRVAIMCAESVPWRCHRSLVADALLAHGTAAFDIMPDGKLSPHKMTSFARVEGRKITYPPENLELPGLGVSG